MIPVRVVLTCCSVRSPISVYCSLARYRTAGTSLYYLRYRRYKLVDSGLYYSTNNMYNDTANAWPDQRL